MPAPRVTKPVILNAIKAAQECGIEVGVVEVSKDGTVRILAKSHQVELSEEPRRFGA